MLIQNYQVILNLIALAAIGSTNEHRERERERAYLPWILVVNSFRSSSDTVQFFPIGQTTHRGGHPVGGGACKR